MAGTVLGPGKAGASGRNTIGSFMKPGVQKRVHACVGVFGPACCL